MNIQYKARLKIAICKVLPFLSLVNHKSLFNIECHRVKIKTFHPQAPDSPTWCHIVLL